MIESLMLIALGFFIASLFAMIGAQFVWRRAVTVTLRNLGVDGADSGTENDGKTEENRQAELDAMIRRHERDLAPLKAEIGRLKLVEPQPGELTRGGDGLFRAIGENGEPAALAASDQVRVVSGALEGSNVNPVESMVAMIDVARRYELQTKMISTADENAQKANSLLSLNG